MSSLILPARSVLQATPRTRIITIDLAEHAFSFTAGQAVFAGRAEGAQRRPYSIACSPAQARAGNMIELLVQIDDPEAPDPHLEQVVPGMRLRIEGPFGTFGLPAQIPERELLLVAGGTGIAPLRSMMWDALEHAPDKRITLIYSARSEEEFAYLDELRALASQKLIELYLTVTREQGPAWSGARGRIDAGLIRSALRTTETRCLICGPPTLVSDTINMLAAAGVEQETIAWESYK